MDSGRGELAVADMKARIAALRAQDVDVVQALWERTWEAFRAGGYTYEYAQAQQPSEPV